MRTDTTTFSKTVYADLRAAGLSSVKAKAARNALISALHSFGSPDIADGSKVRVSMDSELRQSVYMDVEGVARFQAGVRDELQPLVDFHPTDEQIRLSQKMENMLSDIYGAETPEEKKLVKEAYDALHNAVMAINPHVHANISDPDGYEFYHNIHKSEYGFRPRGFITYAGMKEDIERIRRTAENIEFLDQAA